MARSTTARVAGDLARTLAPILGIGMLGALGPARHVAGEYLPVAVAVAVLPAVCGAWSRSCLAREYPGPGGVYRCGRQRFGLMPGWVAASAELMTRVANIAAAAWVFAVYVAPIAGRSVALVVIIGMTAAVAAELAGRRGRWLGPLLCGVIVVAVIILSLGVSPVDQLTTSGGPGPGPLGVLGGAGLVFFVFSGVNRTGSVAEKRSWTVPTAAVALGAVIVWGFSSALLRQLGGERLALSAAPVRDFLAAADAGVFEVAVMAGVAVVVCSVISGQFVAARGVIEAVVAEGDLPRRAFVWWVGLTGLLAGMIVLATDPMTVMLFAAGVALVDNALLNAAARARSAARLCVACVGVVTSLPLLVSLPPVITATVVVIVLGGAMVIRTAGRATRSA